MSNDYAVTSGQSLADNASQLANLTNDDLWTYVQYNNSLQTLIQRNGPVLGCITHMHADYNNKHVWSIDVGADRQVRCYARYMMSNTIVAYGSNMDNYTKCTRVGKGWNPLNQNASFSVKGQYIQDTTKLSLGVDIDVFASDRAVLLANGTAPAWLEAQCLQPGSKAATLQCDWERLFEPDDSLPFANRTANITTMEMRMSDGGTRVVRFSVDSVTFLAFTTYQLDPSPLTNPLTLVSMQSMDSRKSSVLVDPNWVLAAWNADQGDSLALTRKSTLTAWDSMMALYSADSLETLGNWHMTGLVLVRQLPVIQALSLIDFTTNAVPPGTSPATVTDSEHPLLYRNARLYVWAYGLSSRTSKMGATVAILGIIVVLVQFVLGFTDRRQYRSPVQLLIAALEHVPTGRFSGLEDDEAKALNVRFQVMDEEHTAGKLKFHAA